MLLTIELAGRGGSPFDPRAPTDAAACGRTRDGRHLGLAVKSNRSSAADPLCFSSATASSGGWGATRCARPRALPQSLPAAAPGYEIGGHYGCTSTAP
jgi:hypothetical protein